MILLRIFPHFLTVILMTAGCTSASREGLPPDSPFLETAAGNEALLPSGVAVGDVTSRSAVVWMRTDGAKSVQIVWASVEAWEKMGAMASVQLPASHSPVYVTEPDRDFTLSIPIEGLSPSTRYRYRILFDGKERSPAFSPGSVAAAGEFTTWPEATHSVPVTFAWSGDLGGQERCRQGEAGYPIFEIIGGRRPEFFLFLGDIIYGDGICSSPPNEPGSDFVAKTLPEYRAKHRYQHGAGALQKFLSGTPVYVIWDDHEVKDNFSGPFESQMADGRRALREYWPIHTDSHDPHRLYRVLRYGADLEVFILDTRQYRSRNADADGPGKTMLGATQLQWLLDGLRTSTAIWKLVATTVPLSIPKGGGVASPGFDGWAGGADGTGFERERQVIIDAILSNKMKNVVFLGGDVHYVQANSYDPDGDGHADFHEFVAGPLSARPGRMTPPSPTLRPTNLVNDGGYYNFGLVHVTSDSLEVSIIDETGKTRFIHRLQAQSP